MLVFRDLFIIISIYFCSFSTTEASIPNKRLCADPKCSKAISLGTTTQGYIGKNKELLSFRLGANVTIYSKATDSNKDELWGVEIEGRKGFAPKRFIRELKVLVQNPNYTVSANEVSGEEVEKLEVPTSEEREANLTQLPPKESSDVIGQVSSNESPEATPTSPSDPEKPHPSNVDSASSTEAHLPTHIDSASEVSSHEPTTSLPELQKPLPPIDPSHLPNNGLYLNESQDSSNESQEATSLPEPQKSHLPIDPSPTPDDTPSSLNESPGATSNHHQDNPPSESGETSSSPIEESEKPPEIHPTSVPQDDYLTIRGTKIHRSLLEEIAEGNDEEAEQLSNPSSNPMPTSSSSKVGLKSERPVISSQLDIAPSSPTEPPVAKSTSTEITDDSISKEVDTSEEMTRQNNSLPEHLDSEKDSIEVSTEQLAPPAADKKSPLESQDTINATKEEEDRKVIVDVHEKRKEEDFIVNKTDSQEINLESKEEEVIPEPKEIVKEEAAITTTREKEEKTENEEELQQNITDSQEMKEAEPPLMVNNPLQNSTEMKENITQEEDAVKDEAMEEEENLQEREELSTDAQLGEKTAAQLPKNDEMVDNSSESAEVPPPSAIGSELPEKVTNRVDTAPKEQPMTEELKVEADGPEPIPFFIHSLRSQLQFFLELLPEAIQLAIVDLQVSPHLVIFSGCFTFFFLSMSIAFVVFDKRGELQKLSVVASRAEQQVFALTTERDSFKKDLDVYRSKVASHSNTFQTMKQSLDQELESTKATVIQLETTADALSVERDQYLQLNHQLQAERDEALDQNKRLTEENQDLTIKLAGVTEDLEVLTEAHNELMACYNQEELKVSRLQASCDQLLEEAREWDSRVKELEVEMATNKDLLSKTSASLEARELELKGLRQVLQEFNDSPDQEDPPSNQEVEEKMAKILDVGILKGKVRELESEKESLVSKLCEKDAKIRQLENDSSQVREELSHIQLEHNTVLQERTEAQTKLNVLTQYFKEKEVELQRELGFEQTKRQQKETDATYAERTLELLEKENESYKEQLATLRQEHELDMRRYKAKISEEQKKTHDNWHALRNAERKLEDAQKEAQNLRHRLTAMEKEYALKQKSMPTQKAGGSEVSSVTQQSDDSLELGNSRPGVLPAGRPMPPRAFAPPFIDGPPPPPPQFFGERPPFPGGGEPWAFGPPGPPPPFPPPHFPYERPPIPGRMQSPPLFDNRMSSGRFHQRKGGPREEPRFPSPRPAEDLPHRHTPPSGGSPMPRRGVYPSPPDPRSLPPGKFQPIPGHHPSDRDRGHHPADRDRGHRPLRRDRPPPADGSGNSGGGGDLYTSSSQRSPSDSRTSPKEDMV